MEKNNKKMMVVIIALLLVLLLVIVGVSVFAFRMITGREPASQTEISYADIDTEIIPLENGPIYVNLLVGNDGQEHLISVEFSVEVNLSNDDGAELVDRLKKSESIIRDIAITILRDKTYEDIRNNDSNNLVKQELLESLQDKFRSNSIINVYFSDFTHQ